MLRQYFLIESLLEQTLHGHIKLLSNIETKITDMWM